MGNELIKASQIEKYQDIFTEYTHPVLENFIQKVIDREKNSLETIESRKLVRELFLYGFIKATGYEFENENKFWKSSYVAKPTLQIEAGRFYTNNGILALSDFDGTIYIMGGESHHGFFPGLEEPEGIEGTLLDCGYKAAGVFVPHSNGEIYKERKMERLFQALHSFSKEVKSLRGEPMAELIVKDLSEQTPNWPYPRRKPNLPRIILKETLLIPGNIKKTFIF